MDKTYTEVVKHVQFDPGLVEVDGYADQPGGGEDCGELVGYVDDGAYSFAHREENP